MVVHLAILPLFAVGAKLAATKTIAAPVLKAAVVSTHAAVASGAASTTVGAVTCGVVLTGATIVALGGIISKAVSDGYLSWEDGNRYAKELDKLPHRSQQRILANVEKYGFKGTKYIGDVLEAQIELHRPTSI